ncbi:AEL004Wp [Eremothecium gossypii ATCC 10895]|uniref:AEL004Wp n=1 Tax=Eremothecium gossypii (strain ATCC 10895 / CBS 109.51 / FGSC 9923 / NRRL Y-1056) TaxID=284811 RepID=Q757L5_EREGS|nr:AEL004Wp [Eremothecium gossypii ATCC 10895]AAS52681.1 AEL004Wp [Eremothecium gossypii ATCC 10895]AEY96986.1 FAEL004Wp [Eremothecium gossypii FDAG1]
MSDEQEPLLKEETNGAPLEMRTVVSGTAVVPAIPGNPDSLMPTGIPECSSTISSAIAETPIGSSGSATGNTATTLLLADNKGHKSYMQKAGVSISAPVRSGPKVITGSRVGPQRTSRTAQKLKLLPEEPFQRSQEQEDDSVDREVYSQVNRITDKPARRDAEKLGKSHRHLLPRVTAYCTASSYNMKELVRWLKDCKRTHHTHPKLFDECLYTPFIYTDWRGDKRFEHEDVIRLDDEGGEINVSDKQPDLFIFEYGVVVMWGFTEREEKAFLNDLERFEKEKLAEEDVQVEEFNYYITQSYQPRIYNDFITLRDGSNYMIKLSISHAISQSVKISLFEELVDNTIEDTQDIPQEIASSGKVSMSKADIMKSIGELFILRININLHGSVLDSPEIMWSEPQLEPIYQATRGYLEINQRVALLNQRLEVVSDLLQMLKEQLGHSHEENLEFIVILLLGVEVLISVVNIIVDIVADTK